MPLGAKKKRVMTLLLLRDSEIRLIVVFGFR